MTGTKKANEILFDLDNASETVSFKLEDGFILWLQIRYKVFKLLVNCFEKYQVNLPNTLTRENKLHKLYRKLKYYFFLIKYNPLFKKKEYDGLVFSTTIGTFNSEQDEFVSRVNNFFGKHKKILNLYFSQNGKFNLPYKKPFSIADIIYIFSNFKRKFIGSKKLNNEIHQINELIAFLKFKIGNYLDELEILDLQNDLLCFYENYYNVNNTLTKLIIGTKPKFICVEDANYGGGINTQILFVASNLNIPTIEVQHGILDIAYKYGKSLQSDLFFKKQKTNYLLTFGKYWSNESECTSMAFDIGYPFLEDKMDNLKIENSNDILFVSQGKITDSLIEIAVVLSQKLGDRFKVIYRLHPNENLNDKKYEKLKFSKNISFSTSGDIYSLLSSSKFIVGSFSAVIFEASLFEKPIFIHKNDFSDEYIPMDLGLRFTNATELEDLINNYKSYHEKNSVNKFWTLGWENKIIEFYKMAHLN
jgi:hypothetical protein